MNRDVADVTQTAIHTSLYSAQLKFGLLVCIAWQRTFDAVSISYIRSSFFGIRPVTTSFWQSMTSWHIMSFLLKFLFQLSKPIAVITVPLIFKKCSFLISLYTGQLVITWVMVSVSSLHIGQVGSTSAWLNLLFSVCIMYVPVNILAFVMAFLTSRTELLIESQTMGSDL